MVRLREIPRTAAFAWSSGSNPLLVTGTRSGAVDADFSDETKLELWDLNLDAPEQGLELQPVASISTESRFYDIAWGAPSDEHPQGVVAGAMEDGSLQLWDAAKLLAGDDALMSRDIKHTGPIKALQFNPLRPQVLATAGAKGELFVWDINDTATAFRLGTAAAHDIDCVAWNRKVSNILATGSAGGFVTVWDLKTKKASLTLNNNRKAVSAIAWDPNNSTNLLTATSDDNAPVILLWNLRNSQAPERTLQGHDQGILSLSWCQQDPGLLISCGKDNRTVVWNPQTEEQYGEFPEATNWTFLTRFNPGDPNLTATASFDGKITIQTLQNTNPSANPAAQASTDDDDFFSKAPIQLQGASFSLERAPVWLERPVGVSFGYGGKLITFKKNDTPPGQPRSSKIQISSFSIDSDIGSATEKFEEELKSGDIAAICDSHAADAKGEEERADWEVLKALSESNGRAKIVDYLGFAKDEDASGVTEESEASEQKEEPKEAGLAPPQVNGDDAAKKHKRMTSLWGDVDEGDDFLSDLTATKGAKTDNPFQLLGEGNTAEDQVTKAIIVGNFEKAVSICLKENRVADAFVLANCGGKDLVDKVQATYLAQKKGAPSYLRLVHSVTSKNLWDVVYNADLGNWKETMVTLCTFADPSEFPDLCEALGDRIYESGSRKDASFCYLVGSKLEKVVDIWIAELQESEQVALQEATDDSNFSVHARSLQHFIEKVTVFRHVTKFVDNEKGLTEGWKLASLYDKYTEYADIVAAHGHLAVAQRYLDLLPSNFPAAEVARNRVRLATQKAAPQVAPRQVAPTSRSASRTAGPVGYQPPASVPAVGPSPLNPYAPPAPAQPVGATPNPYGSPATSHYAPSGASPYAPVGGFAPSPAVGGYGPPQTFNQPGTHMPPPPKSTGPPPSIKKDEGQWNDVPMVTKPPVRRNTPSVAPITSAFSGQAGFQAPPPVGPYQRSAPTPPPPPPKGSAPPRNVASPLAGPPPAGQHPIRPASTVSNASTSQYAPPPAAPAGVPSPMAPPPLRTASPYNPPPATAAAPNRYAPAPAAQGYGQSAPPPSNPYAPAAQPVAPPSAQYAAPPPQAARPPTGPPPMAGPPPAAGGPPPAARAPPPPRAAAAPSPSPQLQPQPQQAGRRPPGDRSNIPPSAQRMVELLSQDMQRVAAKAPATFAPQVKDTQKRLGLLFDHLNNGELVRPDTVETLGRIAEAIAARDYEGASRMQMQILREKSEECGQWMGGLKRLISMSKATP
ncbi:WD40 repeat-like protein [Parathielavia hyrcaniae]|uniref:Protein transport protein SEC31 n=1 Tax=Parathielavia hyrcaniae TaxID=113614 RepID=A0AAN6T1B9_9PEZI|nr:WD40 repeat-like protein [Parathielavia hyrcaniae]